jgi:2-aminoadipate transaminase
MATSSAATVSLNARDELARRAAETPGVISFAGGLPDPALFPKRQLTHAFVSALQSNAAAALQYGWPEGSLDLREWIASELCSRGAEVSAERIIVTSGAQQAIQIAVATIGHRARIAVEEESYPGALDIFRAAEAQLVPLTDPAGLYYVMPSVSNPRGSTMPAAERTALLARASLSEGFIIEDDAFSHRASSEPVHTTLFLGGSRRGHRLGCIAHRPGPRRARSADEPTSVVKRTDASIWDV